MSDDQEIQLGGRCKHGWHTDIVCAKCESELAQVSGSAPVFPAEWNFIDDPKDEMVRYLIAPTVKKMEATNVGKLLIEIRDGKIRFAMLPANGASDLRQPEQNDRTEP